MPKHSKSLDACPTCGSPWKSFDDNWDTFRCGVQRNVCSGHVLESAGCLAYLVENRDARIASLEAEVERLNVAAQCALEHIVELRDAWMRGAISEHDGLGGLRSNRNVDVEQMLRRAIDGKELPKVYCVYSPAWQFAKDLPHAQ